MSTEPKDQEINQHLYDLFGKNYLDGDKPPDWKATTFNAIEVKDYIDEFVVPYIEALITKRTLEARIQELEVYGGSVYVGSRIDTLKHSLAELKRGLDTNHE